MKLERNNKGFLLLSNMAPPVCTGVCGEGFSVFPICVNHRTEMLLWCFRAFLPTEDMAKFKHWPHFTALFCTITDTDSQPKTGFEQDFSSLCDWLKNHVPLFFLLMTPNVCKLINFHHITFYRMIHSRLSQSGFELCKLFQWQVFWKQSFWTNNTWMNHLLYQLLHAYLLKLCTKELEQGFSHPVGCYGWNLGIFLILRCNYSWEEFEQ